MTESGTSEATDYSRAGQLILWSGVVALAARRGGLLGGLAFAYGVERLAHLTLGTSLWQPLWQRLRSAVEPAPEPTSHRFGEGTRDLVDEASWESFPASDPPGRGVS